MTTSLIHKLGKSDDLSAEERRVLENIGERTRIVSAREDIVREGDRPSESVLIVQGLAARYKLLPTGNRQITSLHIPGDFVDLHGFLLKTLDHGIMALSACRLCLVRHDTLLEITERFPHLTRMLWLSTLVDGAIHRAWLVSMGQRPATNRLAHLLCELLVRYKAIGQGANDTFPLPITQQELGDVLGITPVHVNRVIQDLRAKEFITWQGDEVVIHDWTRLTELGSFDPNYLNLTTQPR